MAALPAEPAVVHRPRRRRWRAAPLLAAAAAVLWLHAGLIALLAPGAAQPGLALLPAVQVRTLPLPLAPAPAPTDVATVPPPAPRVPTAARPPHQRASATALAGGPAANASTDAPALATADARTGATADGGTNTSADATTEATTEASTEASTEAAAPRQPPPLYATRLPDPVQLRYALRYNGQVGEATLSWHHDGQRYSLVLEGASGAGRPLVAQASQGALDAHGLAPERFVDRRRSGRQQAANFRRDTGRIGFSGPAVDYPAWPGAQDRLSWLAQLAAILAAGHDQPEVQLFVVDARGGAGLWRLQHAGHEPGPTPAGEASLSLWQREPLRPEGLRVQAWLSAARGHWPVRLRYTALRSGDVFELQLLAEPAAPP